MARIIRDFIIEGLGRQFRFNLRSAAHERSEKNASPGRCFDDSAMKDAAAPKKIIQGGVLDSVP
jgi:hypothetical protein